jgi:hypothetical protein
MRKTVATGLHFIPKQHLRISGRCLHLTRDSLALMVKMTYLHPVDWITLLELRLLLRKLRNKEW